MDSVEREDARAVAAVRLEQPWEVPPQGVLVLEPSLDEHPCRLEQLREIPLDPRPRHARSPRPVVLDRLWLSPSCVTDGYRSVSGMTDQKGTPLKRHSCHGPPD